MAYLLITVLMGLLVPIQTAANSRLRATVGEAYLSTLISFSVSTLFLLTVALVAGISVFPTEEMLHAAPWWSWLGGICGAITVYGNAWLIPKIGAGLFTMLLLIGQLSLSLLMEQRGWLGAPQKKIMPIQIIGILLMVCGIGCIRL